MVSQDRFHTQFFYLVMALSSPHLVSTLRITCRNNCHGNRPYTCCHNLRTASRAQLLVVLEPLNAPSITTKVVWTCNCLAISIKCHSAATYFTHAHCLCTCSCTPQAMQKHLATQANTQQLCLGPYTTMWRAWSMPMPPPSLVNTNYKTYTTLLPPICEICHLTTFGQASLSPNSYFLQYPACEHAQATQPFLAHAQRTHCSRICPWSSHTSCHGSPTTNVAYNTQIACNRPSHDHECMAFAKPLSCCQHSILVHSCTTKRGSTTYYCLQPYLTHRILWMAWVQHATTQSRGPRVWHWGRSRFDSVHFLSVNIPPLESYSTFHPVNFFSISLSCHSKLT